VSDVTLVFRGFADRPPPFIDARFDVSIVNTATTPRWYVWPLHLGRRTALEPLFVSAVEVSEFTGRGRVRMARCLGDGSSQIVRIAAGATVVIRDVPITLLGPPPQSELTLPIVSAETLQIGSELAERWFQVDVLTTSDADVTFERGAIVSSQDTPGVQPVPILLGGKAAESIRVPLEPR